MALSARKMYETKKGHKQKGTELEKEIADKTKKQRVASS